MKKPNPHFMDRKVKLVRKGKKAEEGEKVEKKQNDDDDDKPKQRISRKHRMMQKRRQKIEILKEKKKQITAQLGVAQNSTKSMGKFDRKAHSEERKLKVKRRKQHSTFKNLQQQVNRNLQVMTLVKNAQGSKKVGHSL